MSAPTKDPWAAASANSAQGAAPASGQSTVQPAATASKDLAGITDPFAGSSAVPASGGQWDPRVPFDEIEGRTVILVPRSFDPQAKDPFNEGETREEYRADIVILDGAPFTFTYKARPEKGAEPVEQTMSVDGFPAVFHGQSIGQGQLIKGLKYIDSAPDKLFLAGVLMRVPQQRDLKAGYTIESIAKSRAAYVEYVKRTGKTEPDTRQRSTWNVIDDPQYMTADRWELARKWWEVARTTWPQI